MLVEISHFVNMGRHPVPYRGFTDSYRLRLNGTLGTIYIARHALGADKHAIYFRRYTVLGRALLRNSNQERANILLCLRADAYPTGTFAFIAI